MREGGDDDEKGMVSDFESVRSLSGREMSSSLRNGIFVCAVVVVVLLMVAVRGMV